MTAYTIRRLLLAIPTILGAATVSFLLMRIVPGDPARVLAGPEARPEDIARLREQMGLDGTLIQQYLDFVGRLLTGDLGTSARTGNPVTQEIGARVANTLSLALVAILIAVAVGVIIGVVAALMRDTPADRFLSAVSVFGVSMPVYWTGLLLVMLFAVHLRWLPAAGAGGWESYILPSVTLSLFTIGFISRQTRSAMVETLGADFIRSVRARGVRRGRVVVRHALRSAALPIVTIIGLQFGQMMGGAVLTETIFAWPGLGRLLVDSISSRDFPIVQGLVFVFAIALILVNLVTDLAYAYIDPRIKYE